MHEEIQVAADCRVSVMEEVVELCYQWRRRNW